MKRIWRLIGFAMIKEAETLAITARDYHPSKIAELAGRHFSKWFAKLKDLVRKT